MRIRQAEQKPYISIFIITMKVQHTMLLAQNYIETLVIIIMTEINHIFTNLPHIILEVNLLYSDMFIAYNVKATAYNV